MDFVPINTDIVLPPNVTSSSITVEVLNDDTLEGLEVFQVVLVGGPGVRISEGVVTVQIIDEDGKKTVYFLSVVAAAAN